MSVRPAICMVIVAILIVRAAIPGSLCGSPRKLSTAPQAMVVLELKQSIQANLMSAMTSNPWRQMTKPMLSLSLPKQLHVLAICTCNLIVEESRINPCEKVIRYSSRFLSRCSCVFIGWKSCGI